MLPRKIYSQLTNYKHKHLACAGFLPYLVSVEFCLFDVLRKNSVHQRCHDSGLYIEIDNMRALQTTNMLALLNDIK